MSPLNEIVRYRQSFESTWADDTHVDDVRFVVLDCETTGLDPRKDRLITIGAVVVRGGEILLEDSFETMLKIDYNMSSVTVHGITRDQARDGQDEAAALRDFVTFLSDGVIVGHHIGHDVTALDTALERNFQVRLENRWIDTMELTLHLEKAGAFGGGRRLAGFSLDALCQLFEVTPHDRHTATGDALMTALVFLKLLRMAKRHDRPDLASLCERFTPDDSEGAV